MDKPVGSWHRFRVEKLRPATTTVRRSSSAGLRASESMPDTNDMGGAAVEDAGDVDARGTASTDSAPDAPGTPGMPGTLAMYACTRCRNSKKKCDRMQPECGACKRLGTRCSFPAPVTSSASQAASLRARVAWLSSFVESLMPAGSAPVSCYETGFDLHSLCREPRAGGSAAAAAATRTPESERGTGKPGAEDYDMDSDGAGAASASMIPKPVGPPLQQQPGTAVSPLAPPAPPALTSSARAPRYVPETALSGRPRLPPIRAVTGKFSHMHLVRAYFRHTHRSYPFLYESTVVEGAESSAGRMLFKEGCDVDLASARLYLVMILGLEAISRFGGSSSSSRSSGRPREEGQRDGANGRDDDDDDRSAAMAAFASVRMPYREIVQACLSNRCIPAVETLLLLAIYALFDPDGWSPWVIVGMLGRESVLLGLNRRWPSSSVSEPALLQQREFRHRLFWCIFSIDRLVASVYGLSLAVQDYDSNLPLPGVTTEEFAASEQAEHIATLQIARQAIALRDIEGRCLSLVHLGRGQCAPFGSGSGPGPSGPGSATPLQQQLPSLRERRALIDELRAAVDNWYTQGTLLARREAHAVHFHNTITWLNTNYHGMLMLLYCPSLFNSGPAAPEDLLDLHRTVRKYVQSVHAQFVDRQLALNWTTVSRMLLVSRVLLHGYLNLCCGGMPAGGSASGSAGSSSCGSSSTQSHDPMPSPKHLPVLLAEQLDMVIQCESILAAFQPAWVFARRGSVLYRRLEQALRYRLRHVHGHAVLPEVPYYLHGQGSDYPACGLDAAAKVAGEIHDICDEADQLLQQALGVASTYTYLAGEPRVRPQKGYV